MSGSWGIKFRNMKVGNYKLGCLKLKYFVDQLISMKSNGLQMASWWRVMIKDTERYLCLESSFRISV